MNYSFYSPYGISQTTDGPSPADVRRWTRFLKARLRKIIGYMNRPYLKGYPQA